MARIGGTTIEVNSRRVERLRTMNEQRRFDLFTLTFCQRMEALQQLLLAVVVDVQVQGFVIVLRLLFFDQQVFSSLLLRLGLKGFVSVFHLDVLLNRFALQFLVDLRADCRRARFRWRVSNVVIDDFEQLLRSDVRRQRRGDGRHTFRFQRREHIRHFGERRMQRIAQAIAEILVRIGDIDAFATVVLKTDEITLRRRRDALLEIRMVLVVLDE